MPEITETYEFDVIIIGAGIVGLAIAHQLSEEYENILVVEKENTYGKHVSSRNSEIIHSGLYYKPGSLKARLCVEGNSLMYNFVRKYNINHNNCGKLIVIPTIEELPQLETLMRNGIDNGVKGLQILTREEVTERESHIKSAAALLVPSTGIVDTHTIMQKLEYLIKTKDINVAYNMEVDDIKHQNDHYTVSFTDIEYKAKSKIIVNSTGLWCDKVSSMVGINEYKLHLCKGEYYKTTKYRNQIHSLIYPLPTELSLGTHIVLHLDGTIGFGPNAYYVDEIDYSMDDSHKQEFLKHINTYLDLDEEDLSEDFTGIRPKIQQKSDPAHDFIIINESEKGYDNFINLIGVESPGLTSSLAISKYVKNIIH